MHWIFAGGFLTGGGIGFLIGLFVVVMSVRLLPYWNGLRSEWSQAEFPAAEFSAQKYAPMTRLLAAEDFDFLVSQPGSRPEIVSKFKRDRRRVFRMYLRELANEFHRLNAWARRMVDASGRKPARKDRARLGGGLRRQQIAFWRVIIATEFRMMTPWLAAGIEVRALVGGVEALRARTLTF